VKDKPLPLPEVTEITGINQWENKLFAAVSNPATFQKMWDSVPTPARECVTYDWPENQNHN
jgi:hypothetical protein